jgi:hypothetical protein
MFQELPKSGSSARKLVFVIYSLCFGGAALNHARDIWQDGFLPYAHVPLPVNFFWTSLTVLDLLVVMALWVWPRVGLTLALLIMVTDVAINSYVAYALEQTTWIDRYGCAALQLQSLFLGFVAGTAPLLWSAEARCDSRTGS